MGRNNSIRKNMAKNCGGVMESCRQSTRVAFLIINFAYNPRLVYGECKGIGEIFYNITGHCFPNPAQCM